MRWGGGVHARSTATSAALQGATGKVRDFGYKLEPMPRFPHWSKRVGRREGGDSAHTDEDDPTGGVGGAQRAQDDAPTTHASGSRGTDASDLEGSSTPLAAGLPSTNTPRKPAPAPTPSAPLMLLDTGASLTSAEAQRKPAETGRPPTRIELLAKPPGVKSEGAQLAVEYCMPVNRSAGEDPAQWRALASSDVAHLLAVSSADLFITLWRTRTFEYAGVLHVLLAQDVLVWSTGANLLFSCNSSVGHVTGWDVLAGSKAVVLSGVHVGPVHCVLDVPQCGALLTGGHDATLRVPLGEKETVLGRSALTKVSDKRCSKEQGRMRVDGSLY